MTATAIERPNKIFPSVDKWPARSSDSFCEVHPTFGIIKVRITPYTIHPMTMGIPTNRVTHAVLDSGGAAWALEVPTIPDGTMFVDFARFCVEKMTASETKPMMMHAWILISYSRIPVSSIIPKNDRDGEDRNFITIVAKNGKITVDIQSAANAEFLANRVRDPSATGVIAIRSAKIAKAGIAMNAESSKAPPIP